MSNNFFNGEKPEMGEKREDSGIIWDCGSPLYDSYEIASFGHLIERKMMALPSPTASNRYMKAWSITKGDHDHEITYDQVKILEAVDDVGCFNKFVGRRLFKRRRLVDQDRNEVAKRLLRNLFSSFSGSRCLCRTKK